MLRGEEVLRVAVVSSTIDITRVRAALFINYIDIHFAKTLYSVLRLVIHQRTKGFAFFLLRLRPC